MSRRSFLDPNSPTPIFQQIVEEFERQILSGDLGDGDFLPSVRDLAVQHGVNPNTVAKAYQQLQVLGLAVSVRGKGLIAKSLISKAMTERRDQLVDEQIRSLVKTSRSLGVGLDDVIGKVQLAWKKK